MRVLVTGASGFIGRFVVTELARLGIETFAAARGARPDIADVRWIEVDLLRPGISRELIEAVAP